MRRRPAQTEPGTPSRQVLIAMVSLVVLSVVASGLLESGLGGEPIASYDDVFVDIAAVDELSARGIDPCPGVGDPVIPADLAEGLQGTECVAFDTSAGLGPAIVGLSVLGAIIVITGGNRFGLYLIWLTLIMILGGLGDSYMVRGILIEPGSLPAPGLMAFLAAPSWIIVGVLIVPRLILIFPSGRLPSPRWQWVLRATWIPALLLIVSQWMSPLWGNDVRNPLPFEWSTDVFLTVFETGLFMWITLVIASFAGLLWRFVIARGDERQQLKWVAYAVALALVVNILAMFLEVLSGTVQQIANFVILPVAVLFSIFKFRLYDIDRIINRTVVYGLVTLVLGGLFGAVVVVPQTLIVGSQGLEAGFVIVVASATIVAAAVFNPLRRRIQAAVDRRFNRTHFDARRVVAGLQERLKEPSDEEALVDDVSSVVDTTMEPSVIGVWTSRGGS